MMDKFKNIIVFATFLLVVAVFYFVFKSDLNFKQLKESLQKASENIELAKEANLASQSTLEDLMSNLNKYENEIEILEIERDSILLSIRRENAENLEILSEIKNDQNRVQQELERLKILRERFQ